jgi:hypothetical protein
MNSSGIYSTASSYTMSKNLNNLAVLCVSNSGTSWLIINSLFTDLVSMNTSIATSNTFMDTYNTYISFVSDIAGPTMNLINCNHKVFATAITIRLNAYF